TKSLDDRDSLCNNIILQPDFKPDDIIGVNFCALDDQLAEAAKTWDPDCPPSAGWRNTTLKVQIPPLPSAASSSDPVFYEVPGFHERGLINEMQQHFSHNKLTTFHYEPFEAYWTPPDAPPGATPIEVRDEVYSSPAMMHYHREVQALKIDDSGCDLPRYLPDAIEEAILKLHGKSPTNALLTHLRRELMQAVWKALLDDEFVHAWFNGVVIKCADGIMRRVFPRIITYSADYPEK
ncbi:hypothetical protein FRC10_006587, partial [Ceratobasidium sp. 414]